MEKTKRLNDRMRILMDDMSDHIKEMMRNADVAYIRVGKNVDQSHMAYSDGEAAVRVGAVTLDKEDGILRFIPEDVIDEEKPARCVLMNADQANGLYDQDDCYTEGELFSPADTLNELIFTVSQSLGRK